MASSEPRRVPVLLLTGALGSGKTTLLAALLRRPEMAETAVVVNEFAPAGIDDLVLADASGRADDVLLLRNGCLCCTPGSDLGRSLLALLRRPRPPARIVVETSGLADPVPLLGQLMGDPRLRGLIRLDGVIATVDALHAEAALATDVGLRQATVADRRIVTKGDLAGPDAVAHAVRRLTEANPGAEVIVAASGAVPPERVFGAGLVAADGSVQFARWLSADRFRAAHADEAAHACLVEHDGPLAWSLLAPRMEAFLRGPAAPILRMKGVLHTDDDPRPLVVHGVRSTFHRPVRLDAWPDGRPFSQLVLIGGPGIRADGDRLRALLATCRAA